MISTPALFYDFQTFLSFFLAAKIFLSFFVLAECNRLDKSGSSLLEAWKNRGRPLKSDTEPIFCLLLVIDQKCGAVAFV